MMNRRWLLGSLFAAALSTLAPLAQALETQPYTAQALAAAQQAGQPVALHFHADWCPTCRQQTTVLNQLKTDPATLILASTYRGLMSGYFLGQTIRLFRLYRQAPQPTVST